MTYPRNVQIGGFYGKPSASTKPQTGGYDGSGWMGGQPGYPRTTPVLHSQEMPGLPGNVATPRTNATPGGNYGDPNRGGFIPYGTMSQGGQMPQGQNPNYPGGNGDRRYYDQARNDLMSRYDTQSGGLQKQYDRRVADLNKMLKGYGNQELADARQQGTNLTNQITGNLTGRGLSGTTLGAAGQAMGATNMQNNLSRINERLQGQKVGLAERTTGDALGFGERAFQGGIGLGQQNIRDSRGDYENDRNFGESQFTGDRAFGRGTYEDDRNFNRGVYENDRNFGNQNFNMDRAFDYNRSRDATEDSFRNRGFNYQQYMDQLNRSDSITRDKLGFMERRNDSGPDIQTLLALMQQMGLQG